MWRALRRRRSSLHARSGSQRRHGNEFELVLWGVPLAMIAISSLLILSTQRQADYADWYHHPITAAVGVVIALALARLRMDRLKPLLIPIYITTVLSLIAVRVIGTSALGAQRWISIAGVNVQPSEFAKLSAILLLAAVLDRFPVERPVDLLRPLGVISIPWALVFIQPDLGTSLVFGALLLTMLYWSGMPFEWLVLLLSPLVTALVSGLIPWGLASPHGIKPETSAVTRGESSRTSHSKGMPDQYSIVSSSAPKTNDVPRSGWMKTRAQGIEITPSGRSRSTGRSTGKRSRTAASSKIAESLANSEGCTLTPAMLIQR